MKGLGTALGLTTAALLSGCSTQYVPRSPTRVSVVMQGGGLAYQRGSHVYHDFLGSGLVDAVSSDPEAKQAAETYFHRNVGGLIATGVGFGCLVGGVAALAVNQPPSSERQALAGGALICALAGEITGLVLLSTAQPYQFDALNIYNDHAEERLLAPRYPYPPPAYPPLRRLPAPVPRPAPTSPPPAPPGAAPAGSSAPAPAPSGSNEPAPSPAPTGSAAAPAATGSGAQAPAPSAPAPYL